MQSKQLCCIQDAMEQALSDHINCLETVENSRKSAAVAAWRTLSLFIITHMKKGFHDGFKRGYKQIVIINKQNAFLSQKKKNTLFCFRKIKKKKL